MHNKRKQLEKQIRELNDELRKIDKEIDKVDYINNSKTKAEIKALLVEEAKKKEARYLVQFDASLNHSPTDDFLTGDADGDFLTWGNSWDLRNFNGVRVQFLPEIDTHTVLRVLKKIYELMVSKYLEESKDCWQVNKKERYLKGYPRNI